MDDVLLMAYVDGALTSHQREEVDRAIRTSAEVATRVALLEASVLPYQRAFQRHPWLPVPQSLIRTVADIAHAHAPPSALPVGGGDRRQISGPSQPGVRGRQSTPVRLRVRMMAPWLAVAFVAGAFCSAAVLRFAPPPATVAAQARMSPWIMAAVNYQRLYTRDTVASDSANVAAAAQTIDTIRRDDGRGIRIPDLRSAGLTFKRIQRLSFNRKPLVQIVYLPAQGAPVALCVMKDERPDTVPDRQQVGNMDVMTWRRSGIAYALIAAPGDADLGALGDRIVDSERS